MNSFQMPDRYQKADFVKDNFGKIASKYDLFNDLSTFFMHRLWKGEMISAIQKRGFKKPVCADLCCGTGDISLLINKKLLVETVYSIDFSENMLEIAKNRLKNYPLNHIQLGDATNLKDFSDSSVDVVTVGFGLRNVSSLEKSISEIYRILKKDGIFVNLDVGKVRLPVIKWFANFYFFKIVPILGYIISGKQNKMFDYLPVSSLYYPDQDVLKEILENQGFRNVQYKDFVFGNATMHWGMK